MISKSDLGQSDCDIHRKVPYFFWLVSFFNFATGIALYQIAFAVSAIAFVGLLCLSRVGKDCSVDDFGLAVEVALMTIQITTMLWWGLYFLAVFAR